MWRAFAIYCIMRKTYLKLCPSSSLSTSSLLWLSKITSHGYSYIYLSLHFLFSNTTAETTTNTYLYAPLPWRLLPYRLRCENFLSIHMCHLRGVRGNNVPLILITLTFVSTWSTVGYHKMPGLKSTMHQIHFWLGAGVWLIPHLGSSQRSRNRFCLRSARRHTFVNCVHI